jgi:FkbM family methyltransferase
MKYYDWEVIDDPMYLRFLKENIDVTKEDIKEMSRVIKKFVFDTTTAVDIGCHYGFFTRFLSEQFKTVHAFDFNNDIFKCFETNMQRFNCTNVIKHNHGLGEKQKYVATNDWSERHKRRGPLGNHIDPEGKKQMQKIKTLDSFNLEGVGLIMCDTEGYELNVVKGALETIKKFKPVLVLEFHNRNLTKKFGYTLKHLQDYVESLGYRSIGYMNKVDQIFVPE